MHYLYIDGFVQDCGNSIANALKLPQSCIKPHDIETLSACERNLPAIGGFPSQRASNVEL